MRDSFSPPGGGPRQNSEAGAEIALQSADYTNCFWFFTKAGSSQHNCKKKKRRKKPKHLGQLIKVHRDRFFRKSSPVYTQAIANNIASLG
jgi:hypothetical protein